MTTTMILALIIFAITYFFIATEKMDKAIAALLGACAVMFCHIESYDVLFGKVDLNVLSLLVGMMIIVDIMATTGVFEWVAVKIARGARGNGLIILIEFMIVTAVFSALLDNVTTVILIAPITILIAQILEIPAIPLLILEAVFSNVGGTATLVGDPPNILIGSKTSLNFNDFIIYLTPVVAVIMVVLLAIMYSFLGKKFKVDAAAKERIMRAKPERAIIDPANLKRALPVFGLVLLGFCMSRYIHVEPGTIALGGAMVMAIVCRVDFHHIIEKIEWSTILFFVGLFIIIGSLEATGLFEFLGHHIVALTSGNLMLTVMVILWFSAIFSAIVDNIPLVIAMIPLIKSIVPVFAKQMGIEGMDEQIHLLITMPLFWALALGACLGGNGTLIGASANVVIAQIARRNKYPLTFMGFTRYGFPIMIVSLIISSGYLYLRYFAFS